MDHSRLQRALDLFAAYDWARLQAYRRRGNPRRIATRKIGRSRALRFDEVGYFNRVYHVDGATIANLPEVLSLYEGSAQAVEFVGAAGIDLGSLAEPLRAAGFRPGPEYARLELELTAALPSPPPDSDSLVVRIPSTSDREAVLDVYLRGFGAAEQGLATAKANMKLLFELPGLHFWLALVDGAPAGIGMLYVVDRLAYLCGGTTLARHEKRGCHTALIRHRLVAAHELGASRVVSWAHANSTSHQNMCTLGLATLAVDRAWVRPERATSRRAA